MGKLWKNRLSLRLGDVTVAVIALAIGATIRPGAVSGDAGRILATFLGLLAASILPTITLLINSMTTSGRSVHALQRLEAEIQAAMDALLFCFGCIAIAIGALLALSIETPSALRWIPYLSTDVLPRSGQAIVVCASGLVIWRAGQIPAILRRTLQVRYQASLEEARNKLAANSPEAGAMRQAFAPHPDHGKVVSLQDLQSQERR
ncbi:hypothetical protein [Aureimonas ureilytica]|uniref:hypothetical protein n=1 Tax=Aureimonas ureilytica TaxID=401562 RepID=UPI000B2D0340|nr:hypothetical protein [Aureimonas ureilytica]